MTNLTIEDIDILQESLDCWVSKDVAGEVMEAVFVHVLTHNDKEAQQRYEEGQKQEKQERKMALARRKESSALLKAKLIGMRRAILGEEGNPLEEVAK